MADEQPGALTPPTDAACVAASGCSRAELAAMAQRVPVGTLLAVFGLPRAAAADEGFVERAAAALTADVVTEAATIEGAGDGGE